MPVETRGACLILYNIKVQYPVYEFNNEILCLKYMLQELQDDMIVRK